MSSFSASLGPMMARVKLAQGPRFEIDREGLVNFPLPPSPAPHFLTRFHDAPHQRLDTVLPIVTTVRQTDGEHRAL